MWNIEFIPGFILGVVGICLGIGGALAMRQGYSSKLSDIQKNIIEALRIEITTLQTQIALSKNEIAQLKMAIDTITYALKKEGKLIVVNGSFVTISDTDIKRTIKIEMRSNENVEI